MVELVNKILSNILKRIIMGFKPRITRVGLCQNKGLVQMQPKHTSSIQEAHRRQYTD
jgi:hypothetical protein